MTGLAGEVIYEAVKFIIMLLLLAGGVVIGGKLRTRSAVSYTHLTLPTILRV